MPPTSAHFWKRVDQSGGPDACWPWMGYRRKGYGHVYWNGRTQAAYRVAWALTNGEVPRGEGYHGTCVLHACDNPPCCNPAHLWLGTHQENVRDREQKGRGNRPRGDASGPRLHPETRARGAANAASKLTAADIPGIFAAVAAGESQRAIARRLGVSGRTIGFVLSGRNWGHIPRPALNAAGISEFP